MRSDADDGGRPAPAVRRAGRPIGLRAAAPPPGLELLPGIEQRLPALAAAWEPGPAERAALAAADDVRRRGWMEPADLFAVAAMVFRRLERIARNGREDVVRISRAAFACDDPFDGVRVLQKLDGISFSTATLVLHVYGRTPCPVFDGPTLACFGRDRPTHVTAAAWRQFGQALESLGERSGLSPQALQRALWRHGMRTLQPLDPAS